MFTGKFPPINEFTVILSILVLVIILCGSRFMKKIPWTCLVVIGTIVASWALTLEAYGVKTIGAVPAGLPSLSFPAVPFDKIPDLLGVAASLPPPVPGRRRGWLGDAGRHPVVQHPRVQTR